MQNLYKNDKFKNKTHCLEKIMINKQRLIKDFYQQQYEWIQAQLEETNRQEIEIDDQSLRFDSAMRDMDERMHSRMPQQ